MLLAVAAQQPRAAGADRRAGLERGRNRLLDARRGRQRQIIVRDEIDARARLETAQPIVLAQGVQGRGVISGVGRMDCAHASLTRLRLVAQAD